MPADLPTLTIARLCRVLENHGTSDLSLPQYRVLGLLSAGDERATQLAARLAVTKPTLTALIDGLVERGFVVRETTDGDRRAVRLSITDAGRDGRGRGRRPPPRGARRRRRSVPRSRPGARRARRAAPGPRRPLERTDRRHHGTDGGIAGMTTTEADADGASTRRGSPRPSGPAPPTPGRRRPGPGVGWLRRLGPFIGRYRGLAIATLIFSVVAQVLIGLLPLIQQVILDQSILSDDRPIGPLLGAARADRRAAGSPPTTPAATTAPRSA